MDVSPDAAVCFSFVIVGKLLLSCNLGFLCIGLSPSFVSYKLDTVRSQWKSPWPMTTAMRSSQSVPRVSSGSAGALLGY